MVTDNDKSTFTRYCRLDVSAERISPGRRKRRPLAPLSPFCTNPPALEETLEVLLSWRCRQKTQGNSL